jgi:acyl carrier protein
VKLTPQAALQVIIEAITRVAPDADVASVPPDAYLIEELETDSMDMLNIAARIYDETGVDIPERDFSKLLTLDEFTAYLVEASGS